MNENVRTDTGGWLLSRFAPVFLAALSLASVAGAQEKPRLEDGQRVLFLGDSNTFAGGFVTYLDAYLTARFPDKKVELINLGLPSETVSGLSEPDHPYPRPHVFQRLDDALTKTKPHLVIAGYGMNDGIYHPFDKEHYKAFKDGIGQLIRRVQAAKAELILATPMPFDARAIKDKLQPDGALKYSWLKPYEDYDSDVLARYAEYLREMKRPEGVQVVDVHQEVSEALRLYRGFTDKGFILSRDGIHPGPMGHLLAAGALGRALNLFEPEQAAEMEGTEGKMIVGPIKALANTADEVRWSWRVGMALPLDAAWKFTTENNSTVRALAKGPALKITGLPWKKARLFEGELLLGEVTADKSGVFWIVPYRHATFSRAKESTEFWKLAQERQKLLGLAWLTDVGHKRPDTPKGIALAEAQKKASAMEQRMRLLAEPRDVELRLAP